MWKLCFLVLSFGYFASAANRKAVAVLRNPATGVEGTVNFEEVDDGVIVSGTIYGLQAGKHGFHIHEKGDISDPKCTSAGGHFNPYKKHHGAPEDEERHVGDLGNLEATSSNKTSFSFKDKIIKLDGESSIMNRSVVIHQGEDDMGKGGQEDSLTTGHAGSRLACGVIENGSSQLTQLSFAGLLLFASLYLVF